MNNSEIFGIFVAESVICQKRPTIVEYSVEATIGAVRNIPGEGSATVSMSLSGNEDLFSLSKAFERRLSQMAQPDSTPTVPDTTWERILLPNAMKVVPTMVSFATQTQPSVASYGVQTSYENRADRSMQSEYRTITVPTQTDHRGFRLPTFKETVATQTGIHKPGVETQTELFGMDFGTQTDKEFKDTIMQTEGVALSDYKIGTPEEAYERYDKLLSSINNKILSIRKSKAKHSRS